LINKAERKVSLNELKDVANVFGLHDENLHQIEKSFDISIVVRDENLVINGEETNVDQAAQVLVQLNQLSTMGHQISPREVQYTVKLVKDGHGEKIVDLVGDVVIITFRGKLVKPKTHGQKRYVDAIQNNDIVFGIGPAGTGKTYCAVLAALQLLNSKRVSDLIFIRSLIQAKDGETGFLSGDLADKTYYYNVPLFDKLQELLPKSEVDYLIKDNRIITYPTSMLRGYNFNASVVLLDETQNAHIDSIITTMTRIGRFSKLFILGDTTGQNDYEIGRASCRERV